MDTTHPDTIHIGPQFKVANTMIGWTSVHQQDHSAGTAAILAGSAHINNTHVIGFGANVNPQPGPNAAYDFAYLDRMFTGYFPTDREMCVTLCGSPPHMRVPKPGAAPDPMGARPTGLYDYTPPHPSWHHEFALLAAAIVARYPTITALQWWNEGKGYYAGDRWQIEQMTDCYNEVWTEVRSARPDLKVLGPYLVCRSYTAVPVSDLADDTFPMNLNGPWGFADKKTLAAQMYFLEHCRGVDALCIDIKTSTNDQNVKPEYQWDGMRKLLDWQAWVRKLAVLDPSRFGRPQADCATIGLWAAEAYTRLSGAFTPARHHEAVATDAWAIINYVLPSDTECWMRWQPEGRGVDSAAAHSIGLWNQSGSPESLQPTEAAPVYAGLVEHFAPGTPLYEVTCDAADVTGLASDSTLCLVSRSAGPVDVVYGHTLTLAAYEVRFIPRQPMTLTD